MKDFVDVAVKNIRKAIVSGLPSKVDDNIWVVRAKKCLTVEIISLLYLVILQ